MGNGETKTFLVWEDLRDEASEVEAESAKQAAFLAAPQRLGFRNARFCVVAKDAADAVEPLLFDIEVRPWYIAAEVDAAAPSTERAGDETA